MSQSQWESLTLEETIVQVKSGKLPTAEDFDMLVSYLERLKSLRDYVHAINQCRHLLPSLDT